MRADWAYKNGTQTKDKVPQACLGRGPRLDQKAAVSPEGRRARSTPAGPSFVLVLRRGRRSCIRNSSRQHCRSDRRRGGHRWGESCTAATGRIEIFGALIAEIFADCTPQQSTVRVRLPSGIVTPSLVAEMPNSRFGGLIQRCLRSPSEARRSGQIAMPYCSPARTAGKVLKGVRVSDSHPNSLTFHTAAAALGPAEPPTTWAAPFHYIFI